MIGRATLKSVYIYNLALYDTFYTGIFNLKLYVYSLFLNTVSTTIVLRRRSLKDWKQIKMSFCAPVRLTFMV